MLVAFSSKNLLWVEARCNKYSIDNYFYTEGKFLTQLCSANTHCRGCWFISSLALPPLALPLDYHLPTVLCLALIPLNLLSQEAFYPGQSGTSHVGNSCCLEHMQFWVMSRSSALQRLKYITAKRCWLGPLRVRNFSAPRVCYMYLYTLSIIPYVPYVVYCIVHNRGDNRNYLISGIRTLLGFILYRRQQTIDNRKLDLCMILLCIMQCVQNLV